MSHPSPRRPWTLWAFSLIIAGLGVYNLALALDQGRRVDALRALGVSYPPLLRAALTLGWGALLLVLAVGLAARRPAAQRSALLVMSNYGVFGVLWMVVYADSDYGRGRIPFQAALTALLLVLAGWVLRWRRVREPFSAPSEAPTGRLSLEN